MVCRKMEMRSISVKYLRQSQRHVSGDLKFPCSSSLIQPKSLLPSSFPGLTPTAEALNTADLGGIAASPGGKHLSCRDF